MVTPERLRSRARSWALALAGVCLLGSAEAGAAQDGEVTLAQRDEPQRGVFGEEFWKRIRHQAERFREREARVMRYAARFQIAPSLARDIIETATAEGVDPELGFRLVWVESRFHPRARGPQGALGLTQLMPATARWLNPRMRTEADILEPASNLRVGFRYLRQLIEQYDGDVRLALLAYNRGTGTVSRVLRQGRDPENGYSRKVMGRVRGSDPYAGAGLVEAR